MGDLTMEQMLEEKCAEVPVHVATFMRTQHFHMQKAEVEIGRLQAEVNTMKAVRGLGACTVMALVESNRKSRSERDALQARLKQLEAAIKSARLALRVTPPVPAVRKTQNVVHGECSEVAADGQ